MQEKPPFAIDLTVFLKNSLPFRLTAKGKISIIYCTPIGAQISGCSSVGMSAWFGIPYRTVRAKPAKLLKPLTNSHFIGGTVFEK